MDSVSDLRFFVELVKLGSLSALAREIGITPPAVSARLAQLEQRLGVRLLNRTTRRLSVTHEGELYLKTGSRLLTELDELDRQVSSSRDVPKGLLRINATFGFGRRYVAPIVSAFRKAYPDVEVQLELTDKPMNLTENAVDVGIRFGDLPDSRLIARKIVANRRLLCASPLYLKSAGKPALPHDLVRHRCIVLRENDTAYGNWHLSRGRKQETVKVHGAMSSNDGETTLQWGLDGHGILMRSEWEIAPYLASGRLCIVLDDWSLPPADIYAVYPERMNLSAKVTAFLDFLTQQFAGEAPWRRAP
ncbi:MAG: LysR family transcriptional regulator [Proteobacteria bacterium]|nr:LysR family transcriptional regulator [Pseudomonadota bacterium]